MALLCVSFPASLFCLSYFSILFLFSPPRVLLCLACAEHEPCDGRGLGRRQKKGDGKIYKLTSDCFAYVCTISRIFNGSRVLLSESVTCSEKHGS